MSRFGSRCPAVTACLRAVGGGFRPGGPTGPLPRVPRRRARPPQAAARPPLGTCARARGRRRPVPWAGPRTRKGSRPRRLPPRPGHDRPRPGPPRAGQGRCTRLPQWATLRRAPRAAQERYELGVIAHGPDRERLAACLAGAVRRFDREARGGGGARRPRLPPRRSGLCPARWGDRRQAQRPSGDHVTSRACPAPGRSGSAPSGTEAGRPEWREWRWHHRQPRHRLPSRPRRWPTSSTWTPSRRTSAYATSAPTR